MFSKESSFHARTKHVEVHYHFIREKVLQEGIELKQVITENQVVDLFTKGLSDNKFESFYRQLCVLNTLGFLQSLLLIKSRYRFVYKRLE